MKQEAILFPVLVLVGHTFLIWCWMYITRFNAILTSKVSVNSYKDRNTAANASGALSTPSDNLKNLFEVPVLFYVAAITLFVTDTVSQTFVVLAWLYVVLRAIHSLVHISYNNVIHRFLVYFASSWVLWAIWAGIAINFIKKL